jgi:hypothetical protein
MNKCQKTKPNYLFSTRNAPHRHSGGGDWEDHGSRLARQKVRETPMSTNKLSILMYTYDGNYIGRSRRMTDKGWPYEKMQDSIQKQKNL